MTAPTYRVVILQEGRALSGRTYAPAAVADIARQIAGVRCFADHATIVGDRLQPARSVRDLVGGFRDPELVAHRLPDGRVVARVEATLTLLPEARWVDDLALASLGEQGGLVGLSIDALARLRPGTSIVEAVAVVRSCDIVTRASAGGRFLRQIDGGRFLRQIDGGQFARQIDGGRFPSQIDGGRDPPANRDVTHNPTQLRHTSRGDVRNDHARA